MTLVFPDAAMREKLRRMMGEAAFRAYFLLEVRAACAKGVGRVEAMPLGAAMPSGVSATSAREEPPRPALRLVEPAPERVPLRTMRELAEERRDLYDAPPVDPFARRLRGPW